MQPSSPLAYFAAPLFNARELEFNEIVVRRLERRLQVFLPQRDGSLLVDMLAAGVSEIVAQRRVFEQDCAAMRKADILIAVLDGGHIDEGVAFEIGFMGALRKPCVGLQTDVRRALPSGNNPMIAQGLDTVFSDVSSLLEWATNFAGKFKVAMPLRA